MRGEGGANVVVTHAPENGAISCEIASHSMEKGCEQAERSGDARERSAADSGEDRLGHSDFKDRVRARLRPAESGMWRGFGLAGP